MLRNRASHRFPIFVRCKSGGCLNWPISTNFTDHLHEVENHWRGRFSYPSASNENNQWRYVLPMFPYPSGQLHLGHMRVYSISDVLNRYFRLNGHQVIHPIGWDAFGLPAENAAIEKGVNAKEWTKKNIEDMRDQLVRLGFVFDWDREICTCDPDYYKWTQWIFLKLYEHGLVSRALSEVNWDPVDKTVLAAEQIDSDGRSWRSGAIAEKKKLKQWAIDVPKYAKRLYDGLFELRYDWKEVADIQMDWIGKCDVYRYKLPLIDSYGNNLEEFLDLRISDPLDLLKAHFILLEPDHPFVPYDQRNPDEPTVLDSNAFNFVTGRPMPLILLPKKLCDASCEPYYMKSRTGSIQNRWDKDLIQSINFKVEIPPKKDLNLIDIEELAQFGNYGGYLTSYKLADWFVSRQRAWGTPIPMILSKDGTETIPISESQLPLTSDLRGKQITDDRLKNGVGLIETDTLDTFFDSSWYYLRYLSSKNSETLVDRKLADKHMPVDVYIGGKEHAAVHLFFARFISHFLHEIGVSSSVEPFRRLLPQGIVRSRTFVNPKTGEYVNPEKVESIEETSIQEAKDFYHKETRQKLISTYEKMSKSKHNGVAPFEAVNKNGIDLTRLQLLEAAAPRNIINWGFDHNKVEGLRSFLNRTSWCINTYVENRRKFGTDFEPPSTEIEDYFRNVYNFQVRAISMFIEVVYVHNTAIARLIAMANCLRKMDPLDAGRSKEIERCLHALVIMLQVFAPNTAAEFWSALCMVPAIQPNLWDHNSDVTHQAWPKIDSDANIDVIVSANRIQCGRRPVNQQTLKSLTDDEVLNLAKNIHRPLFKQIEESSLLINDFRVTRKPGLYVSIELTMDKLVDEKDITDILSRLHNERKRAKQEFKRAKFSRETQMGTISE